MPEPPFVYLPVKPEWQSVIKRYVYYLPHPCEGCGKIIEHARYCSGECSR